MNSYLKKQLKNEFNQIDTPNRKEQLLKDIQFVTQKEYQPKKKPSIQWVMPSLVMVCLLIGFFFIPRTSFEYSVSLDVNPSIELMVDNQQKVTKVITHNDEAIEVLGDMNLVGTDLYVSVNAIIGSMFSHGYIDEIKNSMLVSVQGNDEQQRAEVKESIVQIIQDYFVGNDVQPMIISQDTAMNNEIEKLAKQYEISYGKANLINEYISNNTSYEFKDLVRLSINDINTLAHFDDIQFTTISIDGIVRYDGYLTSEQVKSIVMNHSQVNENEVINYTSFLKCEGQRLLFDVQFEDSYAKYHYQVNAISGEIVDLDIEV